MEQHKKFEGKHSELTSKILGAFFQLHKELMFGFSERVYESAQRFSVLGEDSVKSVLSVYKRN